jgi:YHS domain-containing protein
MNTQTPDDAETSRQRQTALARWDYEGGAGPDGPQEGTGSPHTARDPVCGMDVDTRSAKHHAEHCGQSYYFCSASCRAKFVKDPAADEQSTPPPRLGELVPVPICSRFWP